MVQVARGVPVRRGVLGDEHREMFLDLVGSRALL